MELTAPTAALVIGFPLVMMLVMLLMNTVERWLTSPGRAQLRLVPGGAPPDAAGGEGELTESTASAVDVPAAAEVPLIAALGTSDGGSRTAELHPALQLVKATRSAGRVSAADA
ncbi:hypothetical protein [Pseudofrankia sp. DC12]|uniref:hypothetical protein n=1 Tax=Pseudofrankia sp. DC12 TaxID=683315 RepID=UPI000B055A4E|nr:hypothetical protein [Pseudofrankia sp. DC12]